MPQDPKKKKARSSKPLDTSPSLRTLSAGQFNSSMRMQKSKIVAENKGLQRVGKQAKVKQAPPKGGVKQATPAQKAAFAKRSPAQKARAEAVYKKVKASNAARAKKKK
tara:strand:- start:792 stop:1115 length:324 start_codon:yes stop_codon:yes gene_type:complete